MSINQPFTFTALKLSHPSASIKSMTDEELFVAAQHGVSKLKWPPNVLSELQNRGLDVLDRDPSLRTVLENELKRFEIKAMEALMPLMEQISIMQDQMGVSAIAASLRRASEALSRNPPRVAFGFSDEVLRQFAKYSINQRHSLPPMAIDAISKSLIGDIVSESPEIANMPINSQGLDEKADDLTHSATIEMLSLIHIASRDIASNTRESLVVVAREWTVFVLVIITSALAILDHI